MNSEQPKWRQKTVPASQTESDSAQSSSQPAEFASPEEMLRQDAAQTPLPESLPRRLEDSIQRLEPPRKLSWWKRWLSRRA